jgi:molybdopterin-guanine dinucleotide biosynthesis protein B
MRVVSVIGYSGSGKTTLVEALIRELVSRGEHVAAIKHTHHDVNAVSKGDTARFTRAGASEVMLAGDGQAVIWQKDGNSRQVPYQAPEDLLLETNASWILIEGFKSRPMGAVVMMKASARDTKMPQAVREVEPELAGDPARVAELVTFLGKIKHS